MLRAYEGMTSSEFIAQIRTYVIAMGLGPQVVDQVDNLAGRDEIEDKKQETLDSLKIKISNFLEELEP